MIRLTKPEVQGAAEAIRSVLRDGYLVQGKLVKRFEDLVGAYVGRKQAVAVNSGTTAIQCALEAFGIGEGDEVVVPDFTFPATANAVVTCGATPVLADIDLETFNLSITSLEENLSPRTRAVMPVDLFGLAADMKAIGDLAQARDILLIEDSACALGSAFRAKKCGSFGRASVISFHPRKIVTTGEGGMVLTDDQVVADRIRIERNHGIDVSDRKRGFVAAGSNFRMNEIEACLGVAQMTDLENLIERRRSVARQYDRLLADLGEVTPPIEPSGYFHTYQAYVVLVDSGIDRDRLIAAMMAEGVETGIGTYAIHLQPYYSERCAGGRKLPEASHAFRHSLALPLYPSMGEEVVAQVVSALKKCLPRSRTGT
ncbi:MAG TPA: DegT/DnrJ/EryC1/StrS family aminotransferase [bacterium]|nr:DegT/DnrJ/EryC1/StrS family aminotransferase [bacterium]